MVESWPAPTTSVSRSVTLWRVLLILSRLAPTVLLVRHFAPRHDLKAALMNVGSHATQGSVLHVSCW